MEKHINFRKPSSWNFAGRKSRPKIAICFFGIIRDLAATEESIAENVVKPCKTIGEVKIYSHLFRLTHIKNPRSGEDGPVKLRSYGILGTGEIKLEEPNPQLVTFWFDQVKDYGDNWSDGFVSTKNLLHQLYSLRSVFEMAELDRPDIFVFLRPDLKYHDAFHREVQQVYSRRFDLITPGWQRWDGLNDRFSICSRKAARLYATRGSEALNYCTSQNRSLNSEKLLAYAVRKKKLKIGFTGARASRVRVGGIEKVESFSIISWRTRTRQRMIRLIKILSMPWRT